MLKSAMGNTESKQDISRKSWILRECALWKLIRFDETSFAPYSRGASKIKRIIEGSKLGTKRIAGFGLIEVPPRGVFGPHTHPEREEVYYVLAGSGSIVIEDVAIPASEGMTLYVSGEDSHGLRNQGEQPLVIMFVTATK